ncbi:MAG TPA: DUF1595 domain-containing protein, partial [Polyangia bacterium]|nr:DUF1595 domain-containing protein [Polyangia bacterium]
MIKTTTRPLRRPAFGSFCALTLVAWGCTGKVGEPGSAGSGTGGAPIDPGLIDPVGGGTGGAGNGAGGGVGTQSCAAGDLPVTTRVFRLTHAQYDKTIRTLTGLEMSPSLDFPPDQNQAGFDRGVDLQVGDVLGKAYRTAAETVAAAVVANPTALQKVLGCDPSGADACATSFIASFGRKAYRRPLADDEKASLMALFAQGPSLIDGGATTFQKGVQITLEAMLQSPNFLYRPELSTQQAGNLIVLGGYELASRLSYFIQNGPPDDTLLDAAAGGQLATADAVA